MNLKENLNILYSLDAFNNSDNKTYNFSCVHINARSIRHKMGEIENTLKLLNMPSVLVVGEIFIFEWEEKYFNIPNYTPYFNSRNSKNGGGVAIFIKEEIPSSFVSKLTANFSSFLAVKLVDLGINIIGIYKPPNENEIFFYLIFRTLYANLRILLLWVI